MKKCVNCKLPLEGDNWRCPKCGYAPLAERGIYRFAPAMDQVPEGFNPGQFEKLFELEARNFWFRSRSKLIHSMMRRYFQGAGNFLEIGCGTGYCLSRIEQEFPNLRLTGGEGISAGLHFASRRTKNASLMQMDARNIPYLDEFDLIGAFDVIEHIGEDELVLDQMYAATKKGGGLILTVPQHAWLWSYADEFTHHKRRYSARELASKVKTAGYEILRMTSFVSLLLPAMYLSRLKNKDRGRDADQTAELRLNGVLNFAFEIVMSIERGLISAGIPLGAGGSLLLMARKP